MKINNISTKGFFIYSETSSYEEGDFVVYGNTIYVCSPKSGQLTVQGEYPNESPNFYTYLGDKVATVEEFQNFSENYGGDDKYLTLTSLVSILNTYMKGLDTSGIIGHEFVVDSESGQVLYKVNNKITEVYNEDKVSNVLSDLLFDEKVNYGIFKVSKNLPELATVVTQNEEKGEEDYCILKQYTYKKGTSNIIRVQELIDIEKDSTDESITYANIYYRSADLNKDGDSSLSNLNFISATAHSEYLKRKANSLFSLYSARLNGFRARLKQLENNFCFTGLITGNNTSELVFQNTDENEKNFLFINDPKDLGPLTLTIVTERSSSSTGTYYINNSLCIDLSLGSKKYFITDDLFLDVVINSPGEEELKEEISLLEDTNPITTTTPIPGEGGGKEDITSLLKFSLSGSQAEKSNITTIYYRKYFHS